MQIIEIEVLFNKKVIGTLDIADFSFQMFKPKINSLFIFKRKIYRIKKYHKYLKKIVLT